MAMSEEPEKHRAPHAYEGLDRVLHEKARLGLVVALMNRPDGVLFPDLKELCELTDGNLSRHLAVLSEAGVVEIWKAQDGPRSKTLVRLTSEGRDLFLRYLSELERVVEDARASERLVREGTRRKPNDLGPNWAPA
jgi:DNA-binding MarR family transcriptional regulator